MGLIMTLSIDIQPNSIQCHYAQCRDYLNVMLSVVMLNVIMLNVVMLSIIRLNDVVRVCDFLNVMLSVICHYVECHYAECRYAEWH
jgi:hypothetical protein